LPVLADSVVVIDEVHSFDSHMFSALKQFLLCFDVPVLCLTATLTRDRCDQLAECGLYVYDKRPGRLEAIAGQPRYRLTVAESRESAAARTRDALANGKRVLWVVNTVARCHEIVALFARRFDTASAQQELQTQEGWPIYCYHSRYRLTDRIRRHQAIIDNMKPTRPACLGVTTQVCEMSLDLDVDLLVTEECPVTSLIQRMGRCNREQEARPLSVSGEVIVYPPHDQLPYSTEDLTGLTEFLALVGNRDLSQATLEQELAAVPAPPWDGDHGSPFLTSGPYAVAKEESFRDSNDFSRECVLFEDVDLYLKAGDDEKPGFVLPVPKRWATLRDREVYPGHGHLPRYLGVADAGHYHALLGYCDQALDQWRAL
jgi:CRISPR-associated endonuclease/helicase Cas3